MIELVCVQNGQHRATFADEATVNGVPIKEWFRARGGLCKTCLMAAGEVGRDQGMDQVDDHTPREWKEAADAACLMLLDQCRAGQRDTFTPEDIRAIAGDPPHFNAMGARFMKWRRSGLIEPRFEAIASRPQAHRCRLRHYGLPV